MRAEFAATAKIRVAIAILNPNLSDTEGVRANFPMMSRIAMIKAPLSNDTHPQQHFSTLNLFKRSILDALFCQLLSDPNDD